MFIYLKNNLLAFVIIFSMPGCDSSSKQTKLSESETSYIGSTEDLLKTFTDNHCLSNDECFLATPLTGTETLSLNKKNYLRWQQHQSEQLQASRHTALVVDIKSTNIETGVCLNNVCALHQEEPPTVGEWIDTNGKFQNDELLKKIADSTCSHDSDCTIEASLCGNSAQALNKETKILWDHYSKRYWELNSHSCEPGPDVRPSYSPNCTEGLCVAHPLTTTNQDSWPSLCQKLAKGVVCTEEYRPMTCRLAQFEAQGANPCFAQVELKKKICASNDFTSEPAGIQCSAALAGDEQWVKDWQNVCAGLTKTAYCSAEHAPHVCTLREASAKGSNSCHARRALLTKVCSEFKVNPESVAKSATINDITCKPTPSF